MPSRVPRREIFRRRRKSFPTTPRGIATSPRARRHRRRQLARRNTRRRANRRVDRGGRSGRSRERRRARGRARLGLRRRVGNRRRRRVAERVENPEGAASTRASNIFAKQREAIDAWSVSEHSASAYASIASASASIASASASIAPSPSSAPPFARHVAATAAAACGSNQSRVATSSNASVAATTSVHRALCIFSGVVDALGVRRQTVPDRRSIGARRGAAPTAASEYKPATAQLAHERGRDGDVRPSRVRFPVDTARSLPRRHTPRPRFFARGVDAVRSPEDSDVGAKSASKSNPPPTRDASSADFPGRTPAPRRRRGGDRSRLLHERAKSPRRERGDVAPRPRGRDDSTRDDANELRRSRGFTRARSRLC